jgi:hypothetical protein
VADPVLDVVTLEFGGSQPCGYGADCFVLVVAAAGTRTGKGSCEVWATNIEGDLLGDEPGWTSGDFTIEPGEKYEWELVALIPTVDRWEGDWDAICRPAPEG